MKIVYTLWMVIIMQGDIEVAKVSRVYMTKSECIRLMNEFIGIKDGYPICAPTLVPDLKESEY